MNMNDLLVTDSLRWVIILVVAGICLYIAYRYISRFLGSQTAHSLDMYAIDLTSQARNGTIDPVVGRDEEIHRVLQILARRTKNNVILIGPPGVGKTAIVDGIALKIASGDVPELLKNKRVLVLQVAELLAGTKYRGDFEQRIKGIVQEIRRSARTIILFIDEVHTITQTKGAEGGVSLSDILKPPLARGDMQLIGATSKAEYEQYIRPDESWNRRFQIVIVDEPTVEETIAMLRSLRERYEQYHHVTISDESISVAARLSEEYIKDRNLPDKAIDVMDEAAAKVNIERGSDHAHAAAVLHGAAQRAKGTQGETPVVLPEHVREVIAEWVNMYPQDIH